MGLILIFAIVFLVGTGLAALFIYDSGLISMVWGDWVIETSVSFVLVALVLLFLVVYVAIRLFSTLWNMPKFWRRNRRLSQYKKAETALAKGMIALEYGDWGKAEKELIKSAKQSEDGLMHYLSAAKMAHNQKAHKRRDCYLAQARENYLDDSLTIGLVEARLLSESEPEAAWVILESLLEQAPKNTTVLLELAHILQRLEEWNALSELLPRLKKSRAMNKAEQAELEETLFAGKILRMKDQAGLEHLWDQISSERKIFPKILAEYVEKSLAWGQEKTLSGLIERAIKKQWDDRLVYQYGRIGLGEAVERLKTAETWLKKGHENNPVLLLTLGRLACASQLWGRGQNYLKESLKIRPEIETFHALAKCYEAEGKESQAALIYKEAILKLGHVDNVATVND
ncbi:MAG: heme biosynthesis protein HemY [Thiomicrorhabdus sp.]|nr:heme biosynthesis protein HemY [Thiomicrorhabdus sp.]